jgi:hypothetical protein
MKILILSTFERTGGASVAANRLLLALRKEEIDASMLVRDKRINPNVVSIQTSRLNRKINFLRFAWNDWLFSNIAHKTIKIV